MMEGLEHKQASRIYIRKYENGPIVASYACNYYTEDKYYIYVYNIADYCLGIITKNELALEIRKED